MWDKLPWQTGCGDNSPPWDNKDEAGRGKGTSQLMGCGDNSQRGENDSRLSPGWEFADIVYQECSVQVWTLSTVPIGIPSKEFEILRNNKLFQVWICSISQVA